ncbi:MAG: hypothetical protein U9R69_09825 [Thermodesulfobacteriota bacterium]|nr:hypothetical protein [Thermodesulfobacteriota bacterium]
MRQQINLYRDELIDRPEPFQSRQTGLILAMVVVGLVLVGCFSYWQTRSLTAQVVELRQQQQVASGRVAELEKQFPKLEKSVLLQKKIHRLEEELQGKRDALDYFSRQDKQSNGVILESLENLARYRQPGIWLQRITILQRGQEVQLFGSALKPEQIPEYLQLLGEKNVFGGQVFARLKLDRLKEKDDQINFRLDSVQDATQ